MRLRFVSFMVLFITGLLAAALSISPLPATAQQGGLATTLTSNASLRTGPGTDWNRAALVDAGTPIVLDGRAPGGGWARGIIPNGTVGWVVYTALAAAPADLDALPSVWVDDPFTLTPPAGGAPAAPTADPAAPAGDAAAPAVTAPPPPPVVNSAPVAGFNLGGHVAGLDAFAVDAMRRAGMTWVKKQVRYQLGQDPGSVAGLINEAHANGFRVLLGVVGLPDQVMQGGYFEAYAAFVGGVAALGADAIEVWNEPNIDREWPAGNIDPALYTRLLAQAYNAINAANPSTLVISGAPAPTGFFGGCTGAGCDDNLYMSGMYAAGAANYMDCVGIHYNEGILPPTATSGDPRGSSTHYSRYFLGMVNTYNAAMRNSRPLCFTEFGYLSPEGFGPLPGSFGWAENVTVAQQAQWLDQAASMAARRNVRLMIIWNVNFTNYGEDPMAGFAIIRPGGGCPACDLLGS